MPTEIIDIDALRDNQVVVFGFFFLCYLLIRKKVSHPLEAQVTIIYTLNDHLNLSCVLLLRHPCSSISSVSEHSL